MTLTATKSKLMILAGALVLTAGLSACEEQGPAEQIGEQIDESIDKTGEALEEAGEEIQNNTQ